MKEGRPLAANERATEFDGPGPVKVTHFRRRFRATRRARARWSLARSLGRSLGRFFFRFQATVTELYGPLEETL